MGRIIDSSLWVDLGRTRTTPAVRLQVRGEISHREACVCEPIIFEIMRASRPLERPWLEREFAVVPMLTTPPDLWRRSTLLGQRCRDAGFTISAFDLLIATIALHHDAEIITFDGDFSLIAQTDLRLRVHLLIRAA